MDRGYFQRPTQRVDVGDPQLLPRSSGAFFLPHLRVENFASSDVLAKGSMLTHVVLDLLLHVAIPIQSRASSRA